MGKLEDKRKALSDYAEDRQSMTALCINCDSRIRSILTCKDVDHLPSLNDDLLDLYKSITSFRNFLENKKDEFYIEYGDNLDDIFSKAERERGTIDRGIKFGVREKEEILMALVRAEDDHALSDPVRKVVSHIENNNGYYRDTEISTDRIKTVEHIYARALYDEYRRTHPDEIFITGFEKAQEEYYDKQLSYVKKYIDLQKWISSCKDAADGYAEMGDAKNYASMLDEIRTAKSELDVLSNEWKEEYGMDSLDDASSDMYDQVYPDDDFEWYSGDLDFTEEENKKEDEQQF